MAVDTAGARTYHRAPMSAALPVRVDVARQVQAGRIFEGTLPLASMQRLRGSLAETEGAVRYRLEFGKDALGVAFLALHVDASLMLICQRSLDVFAHPVVIDGRLGLIASEEDEASLPDGYEPLVVSDGQLDLADVVEDELILALPVVPVKPGEPLQWNDPTAADEAEPPGPFAALGALKKH